MRFEWDEAKRQSNLEKHGVDFILAQEVLQDPYLLTVPDHRRAYGEMRMRAVGQTGDLILFVAFTVRSGTIRLISARLAHHREREAYWRGREEHPSTES